MIITSFDIGIRNLSYCILEYFPNNESGNQFLIYDWNVVNLLDDKPENKTTKTKTITKTEGCEFILESGKNKGKVCGREIYAHFQTTSLCKKHKNTKAYKDKEHLMKRVYNQKNITIFELSKMIVNKLDKIDFSKSDEVIFESQPSKNPKMKNLSFLLFNYFVMRYVAVDSNELKEKFKNISYVNAKNKLKVYDGPYVECKLKNQYSRNKFYGKVYCEYLIRKQEEKVNFFNSFKKRDDLADSFLQGVWYLMKNLKTSTSIDIPCQIPYSIEEEDSSPCPPFPSSSGKMKLNEIANSQVSKDIMIDRLINKYRNLKRGRNITQKQQSNGRFTLGNIKYIMNHYHINNEDKLIAFYNRTDINSNIKSGLRNSLEYYFSTRFTSIFDI